MYTLCKHFFHVSCTIQEVNTSLLRKLVVLSCLNHDFLHFYIKYVFYILKCIAGINKNVLVKFKYRSHLNYSF